MGFFSLTLVPCFIFLCCLYDFFLFFACCVLVLWSMLLLVLMLFYACCYWYGLKLFYALFVVGLNQLADGLFYSVLLVGLILFVFFDGLETCGGGL